MTTSAGPYPNERVRFWLGIVAIGLSGSALLMTTYAIVHASKVDGAWITLLAESILGLLTTLVMVFRKELLPTLRFQVPFVVLLAILLVGVFRGMRWGYVVAIGCVVLYGLVIFRIWQGRYSSRT